MNRGIHEPGGRGERFQRKAAWGARLYSQKKGLGGGVHFFKEQDDKPNVEKTDSFC